MPPDEPLVVTVHEGGRILRAVVTVQGGDLTVAVDGGDRPHVGCVVLAVPREPETGRLPTVSVLALPHHREEAIARPMAETLAARLGAVTVVAAGVHENGATPEAIARWLELAQRLTTAILARLDRS